MQQSQGIKIWFTKIAFILFLFFAIPDIMTKDAMIKFSLQFLIFCALLYVIMGNKSENFFDWAGKNLKKIMP